MEGTRGEKKGGVKGTFRKLTKEELSFAYVSVRVLGTTKPVDHPRVKEGQR